MNRSTILSLSLPLLAAAALPVACSSSNSDTGTPTTSPDGSTQDTGAGTQDAGGGGQDTGTAGDSNTGTPDAATADASVTDASVTDASSPPDSGNLTDAALGTVPGYTISVWAQGTAQYFNPDSITNDGTHIWIGYQNKTTKDGSDGGAGYGTTSTVVEYSLDGKTVMAQYAVPGHCDGLRADPASKKVWGASNEDGSPHLFSIDPTVADASAAVTEYTIKLAAGTVDHGGGYDDIQFLGGTMFISASNPANPGTAIPALESIAISGTTATFTSVLMSNAPATDIASGGKVTLSEADPDSLALDDKGQLVMVNQGGSEVVFLANPGTAQQTVSRLAVGNQLEDPVWITKAQGQLLLVDGHANAIYSIRTAFTVGTVYTETPFDSTVPGILGTLDISNNPVTSGFVTPVIIGFKSPTGLLFLPD